VGHQRLFGASDPPNKAELRLPVASTSAVQALDKGSSKQEVIDSIGKSKVDSSRALTDGTIETCWLYRVQGSEANQRGHFPLWSLCFEDNTLARKGRFRQG
jgi:hypothetical protein